MKRKRSEVTQVEIYQAALALLDAQGLAEVSMRSLGARLGVQAMSLYNHVANKDEVLDGVVTLILEEVAFPPPGPDWKADLIALAEAFRVVLLRHPNALPLISTRSPRSPGGLEIVERVLAQFTRGGLTGAQAFARMHILNAFILGHAWMSITPEVRPQPGAEGPEDAFRTVLGDARRFPNLSAVIAQAVDRSGPVRDLDGEFREGLERLLDGAVSARSDS